MFDGCSVSCPWPLHSKDLEESILITVEVALTSSNNEMEARSPTLKQWSTFNSILYVQSALSIKVTFLIL